MTSEPVRVADASTPEWACAWDPVDHVYVWKRRDGGGSPIRLWVNGSWAPGDPQPCQPFDPRLPARALLVEQRGVLASWEGQKYHRITSTHLGDVLGYGDDLNNPGVQGGYGIDLNPPEPTEDEEAAISAIIQRNPIGLVHSHTGQILTRRELGHYFEYRLDRGADSIQNLPHFPRNQVPVLPDDKFHLCRALMRPLGKWRRSKLPHLRQFLLMLAEDVRVSYTMGGKDQDPGSDWQPFSLRKILRDAYNDPHTGGEIVRGFAWALRAGVIALELGPPNRDEWEAWVASMVTYAETVQMANGFFANHRFGSGIDQEEPWNKYGLDTNCGECPSWQVPFLIRALWEAQKQVPQLASRVRLMLMLHKDGWDAAPRVPDEWDAAKLSLPCYLVTSRAGVIEPTIIEGVGPGRGEHDHDLMAVWREAGLIA